MIYLCRHGQTTFNAVKRYQGQVDSPLTDLGQAQASAVGRRLRGLITGDMRLYSSPLGRAHDSAKLIAAELGHPEVILDPRLMEIGMGAWDGLDDFEIEAEFPGARDGLAPGTWFFHSPDGEDLANFTARLAAVLAEISNDPATVKIVVSHGVAGRVLRNLHSGQTGQQGLTAPVPQDRFHALLPDGRISEVPS